MALPILVAEELGMKPEDFSLMYQDTDAAPVGHGLVRVPDDASTAAARSIEAAQDLREQLLDAAAEELEADRDDLELAEGAIRVKGAPEKSVTIVDLAGSGATFHGKGSGDVPEAPPVEAERLRRHGSGSSRSSRRS